jgi:hypothetical protein
MGRPSNTRNERPAAASRPSRTERELEQETSFRNARVKLESAVEHVIELRRRADLTRKRV